MTMSMTWIGWFPWEAVRAPEGELATALLGTGAYLIACAPEEPAGTPSATCAEVVYIGETHRRGRSLRQRLLEFGNSAGFNGDRRNGHSGGWRWPPKNAGNGGADHCWVAIAPTPTAASLPLLSMREIYPTWAESMALWEHVRASQKLPSLNARERSGTGSDLARPPVDLHALLRQDESAATALVEWVATRWSGCPRDQFAAKPTRYESGAWRWHGVEYELPAGWWIGVGWSEAPAIVDVWVWKQESRDTFRKTASSVTEAYGLIDALIDWWCE